MAFSRRVSFLLPPRSTPYHWNGVWDLGTKVLQPRVRPSRGAASRTSFIICIVSSTSSSSSPGTPTIPYSFSFSSPPSWALAAAIMISSCSSFLLTICRTRGEPLSTATVRDLVPRRASMPASSRVTVLVRTEAILILTCAISGRQRYSIRRGNSGCCVTEAPRRPSRSVNWSPLSIEGMSALSRSAARKGRVRYDARQKRHISGQLRTTSTM
mmetsp:Transcript_44895/g.142958  ORF Transcript_44895/g.142958 Transcript_44895/m.142958 type:complete len:213 (+) Transcript_44895:349-987(+)